MCNKPTAKQTAWVFDKLLEAYDIQCSYRNLIYTIMKYAPNDYETLLSGMTLNNIFIEHSDWYDAKPELVSTINELLDFVYKRCDDNDIKQYRKFTDKFTELLED